LDTGGKTYALKFISGKYQGGEFPLTPGKEVLIGRSSDLELVLLEEMVSRKHARLLHGESGLVITDLGSTNGTFVNGEKVTETVLKEGDRFLIGTSIFKVVTQQEGTVPLDDQAIRERLEQVAAAKPRKGGAMNGRIDEVSIPNLLQLFQASRKSGVLELVNDAGQEGKIYLDKGRITYAQIGDDEERGPLKSVYRLIRWASGTFELAPPESRAFPTEIQGSTEGILMEGSRQQDEMARLEPDLPPPGVPIVLSLPLKQPLRELDPEQLDLLQLALTYPELDAILDHAPGSDLDTATQLAELFQRGYLRAAG